jgi:hypothetical protein
MVAGHRFPLSPDMPQQDQLRALGAAVVAIYDAIVELASAVERLDRSA